MQALSAVDEHGAELLSPGVQATGEMAFVVVAFGRCDGRSTGRGIRHHVRPNRLGSAWGACAAAGSRWIRRVVVGAVGKVSARAGSRRHHQPAHRLVPVDGRPVGGVGDRRRHAGRRITRRLGQLVLWATVAVVFARLANRMLDAKTHRHLRLQAGTGRCGDMPAPMTASHPRLSPLPASAAARWASPG